MLDKLQEIQGGLLITGNVPPMLTNALLEIKREEIKECVNKSIKCAHRSEDNEHGILMYLYPCYDLYKLYWAYFEGCYVCLSFGSAR